MYVMITLAVIGLLVLSGNRIVSCISGQSRRQGGQDTKLADTERKEDMKAQAYQEQFQELKEQISVQIQFKFGVHEFRKISCNGKSQSASFGASGYVAPDKTLRQLICTDI